MSEDDDQIATWSQQLAAIDVDATQSERIQQRTRREVGRGPSPKRFVLPAIATLGTAAYLSWTIYKIIEIFK